MNHEFLGEQEARINGVRMTSDLDGTRVYYGAGVDWQTTDNLRLYMQSLGLVMQEYVKLPS